MEFHTYKFKEERSNRVVLKNMPYSTSTLKKSKLKLRNEIIVACMPVCSCNTTEFLESKSNNGYEFTLIKKLRLCPSCIIG
jgi:hypothetical protein